MQSSLEIYSFPLEVLFALIVGGLLYLVLSLGIRSVRRIARREASRGDRIVLAGSAVAAALVLLLPAFVAKLSGAVMTGSISVVIVGVIQLFFKGRSTGEDQKGNAARRVKWALLFAAMVFMTDVAWYPFNMTDVRNKALNAEALSSLRDAKECLEAVHRKQGRYPDSLEQGGCAGRSVFVTISYSTIGPAAYALSSLPQRPGDREYKTGSGDPAVYWRSASEGDAEWRRL